MKLFADRHTWFDHELTCHRLEWCCRFCSYPAFATQDKLAAHMHTRHLQLSSLTELPGLLHASKQVVDRIPAADCLLCDWESILRQQNTTDSPTETLVVTLDQFRRHVASHMEQLALFALPRNYQGQGAEENSNEAAAAAGSNESPLVSSGESTWSWGSTPSFAAAQDQALPDLAVDEKLNPFEDADYLRTGRHSLDPWSSTSLKHIPNYDEDIHHRMKWSGAAFGQICFRQGEIYIHGGVGKELKLEEKTYEIDMSEGQGILRSLGRIGRNAIGSRPSPGPRAYAAAVSYVSRNAFVVFGGYTVWMNSHQFPTSLYWLDTSIFLASSDASYADHVRYKTMV